MHQKLGSTCSALLAWAIMECAAGFCGCMGKMAQRVCLVREGVSALCKGSYTAAHKTGAVGVC